MIDSDNLQQVVKNAVAESYKMPSSQPHTFHLQMEATVPIGPVVAKVELGVSVEDGKVETVSSTKLEGLLAGLMPAETGRKRKPTQHAGQQSRRTSASPSASTERGRRDMRTK